MIRLKLYISADIEGVSGVVHSEHTQRNGREHDRARAFMTQEVNACITGALEVGVTEVIVNDSHGTMRNILLDHLHPQAELISGSPKRLAMVEGLDESFDVAAFIGYHTRMGTAGILNHTFHGGVIQNIKINGVSYGEFGLNAAVAGYYQVPVVMVSGCNLLSREATNLIPSIHVAVVKETINRTSARNLSLQKSQEIIRSKTISGIKDKDSIESVILEGPLEIEVAFLHTGFADIGEILPVINRSGTTSVSFKAGDIIEAYRYIRSLIMMAGSIV